MNVNCVEPASFARYNPKILRNENCMFEEQRHSLTVFDREQQEFLVALVQTRHVSYRWFKCSFERLLVETTSCPTHGNNRSPLIFTNQKSSVLIKNQFFHFQNHLSNLTRGLLFWLQQLEHKVLFISLAVQ